ncbi:hypothetical protein BT69DRAFT_1287518 [Atractiella rhizophila]|nr:hypothetical protein BT69DRAFT_1287518 [Atractiella rhizophila]
MDRVRAPAEGRRNTDGGANPLRPHPHHYQSASAASGEDNAVDWVRQRNFRLRRRLPELLRAPRSSPTPLPLPPPRPVEDLQLDDDDDDNDSILSFETVSTPIRATSPRTDATSEEEEEEEKEEPTPIPPPTRPLRRETMRTVEHGRILRSSSGPFHPVILPLRRRTESEVREVQSGLGLQRMRI